MTMSMSLIKILLNYMENKVIYIVLENNFNYGILKLVIVECFLNSFFVSYNNCKDRHDYHLVCIAALCDVMAYVYQEVY